MSPFGALGRKWPRRRHQGSSLLNSNSTADAPLNCLMCLSMREELKPYILIKLHRTQDTSATSNTESKDQLRRKSEISPNIRNSFATSILATNMLLLQHHVGPCVYMWKSITGFSTCTICMLEGPTPFCRMEEHSKPWSFISPPHLMTTKRKTVAPHKSHQNRVRLCKDAREYEPGQDHPSSRPAPLALAEATQHLAN